MEESLIDKYPHLKTLLEGQDKSANGQSAEGRETVRKSILGPGVGPVKSARAASPARKNVTPGQKKLPAKADELFARSKGADKDHWLNFKIDESLAARQQMEPLELWLVTNKPSEVTRESGVGWISVKLGDGKRRVKSAEAKAEWDGLKGERNMDTVNSLAASYGDTGGKWLYHVTVDQVDESWATLAKSMLSGGLGPLVSMIKVSPRTDENSHVIIVYNDNYQNTKQVMRNENLLRSAGVTEDLLYKPDIFSTLGIYRNNIWGFRPTIYSSVMMKSPGKSKISVAGTGKWYINSSSGITVEEDENMNMIVTDVSKPDPSADYNKADIKGEGKKKQIPAGRKRVEKVDQNGSKKRENDKGDKKSKDQGISVSGLWMNLEMLNMKSLDEFVKTA